MIAIDFGTTNSSVVVWSEGDTEPRVRPLEYGDSESYEANVLPSVVCECLTHSCLKDRYGHEALRHGFEQQHDSKLLQEMKLYFDRSTIDRPTLIETRIITALREEGGILNPVTKIQRFACYRGDVPLKPSDFVPGTAKLFREIIRRSDARPNDKRELVIGFPASFHAKGVRHLREAAKLGAFGENAGYEKVFMYLEPVAAARAYMKIAEGNILVLDYGGGTLDISVLKINDPEKFAKNSIHINGFPEAGASMDEAIVDYCRSKDPKIETWFNAQPLKVQLRFKRSIEKAKVKLSTEQDSTVDLSDSGLDPFQLTILDISYALQPIMTRMVSKVMQTIIETLGSIDKVDFVVMSGGACLSKVVQTSVLAMFKHLPPDKFVVPDARDPQKVHTALCAVAKGLALLRMDGHESVNIGSLEEIVRR